LNFYPNTPTKEFAAPMLGSAHSWFGFMNGLKVRLKYHFYYIVGDRKLNFGNFNKFWLKKKKIQLTPNIRVIN